MGQLEPSVGFRILSKRALLQQAGTSRMNLILCRTVIGTMTGCISPIGESCQLAEIQGADGQGAKACCWAFRWRIPPAASRARCARSAAGGRLFRSGAEPNGGGGFFSCDRANL